jgi:hypothetical protein
LACHQGFVRLKMKRHLILYRYKLLRLKILVECSSVRGSRFRNYGRYFFHFSVLLLFCNPALTSCIWHCITKEEELSTQITWVMETLKGITNWILTSLLICAYWSHVSRKEKVLIRLYWRNSCLFVQYMAWNLWNSWWNYWN